MGDSDYKEKKDRESDPREEQHYFNPYNVLGRIDERLKVLISQQDEVKKNISEIINRVDGLAQRVTILERFDKSRIDLLEQKFGAVSDRLLLLETKGSKNAQEAENKVIDLEYRMKE